MNLDDLLRYKALHFKYISENLSMRDLLLDEGTHADQIPSDAPTKNVCAMVSQNLFDDLTSVCDLLGITKQSLIEAALIEALNRAAEILEEEGVEDMLVAKTAEGLYEHADA